ncbi:hypothetical protein C8R43DRAFT_964859 [Mycena crocata]|nr:hypothetical protein C8R43DRAFT_964859 [Mycena crocata]
MPPQMPHHSHTRLAEQDATGVQHEPDEDVVPFCDVPPPPPPPPVSLPHTVPPPPAGLSAKVRNKLKSRARRDKKRDAARDVSANPLLKSVSLKRVSKAKASALEVDVDATALPHSKPSWRNSNSPRLRQPHDLSNGLGTKTYTQAELDAFSGTEGFMYIDWLGSGSGRHAPRSLRMEVVTTALSSSFKSASTASASQTNDYTTVVHRRPMLLWRVAGRTVGDRRSRARGQQCCQQPLVTDELLAHDYFKRIAQFATILFALWHPPFTFYQAQMMLLAAWKPSMRRNFARAASLLPARSISVRAPSLPPHLDFANLAGAGGDHSARRVRPRPRRTSHLGSAARHPFPSGSTILLPSALIRHSNVDIRPHERRASFAQYTAGGLFRWVRNGFKTDEAFEMTASPDEMAARAEENGSRWEEGLKMFSTIDDL